MKEHFFLHRIAYFAVAVLLMVVTLVGNGVCVFAEPDAGEGKVYGPEGEITAQAVILIDAKTGIVLFEKNPDRRMYPASTTKIMTAMVALEAVEKGEVSLDQEFELSQEAFNTLALDGSSIYLKVGEKMTLDNLLKGLLIASGNDTAVTIAEGIAGSIDGFVERMNKKASDLGLQNTHFVNPHGLHDENHYTTARELSIITKKAMENETFRSIVECAHIYLDPTEMTEQRYFINTNNLVSRYRYPQYYYEYATGVKTGFTSEAGACLVSSAEKDGRSVISVVMNAQDSSYSHNESRAILDYGLNNFAPRKLAKIHDLFGEVKVEQAADDMDHIILSAKNNLEVLFPIDGNIEDVEQIVEIPDEVTAPVYAGQVVGKVSFVYKGQKLGEVELVSRDNVDRSALGPVESFFEWIWSFTAVRVIIWILVIALVGFLTILGVGFARALKKSKRKNRRRSNYRPPRY